MTIEERVVAFRNSRDRKKAADYFVEHPNELEHLHSLIIHQAKYPLKEYASWLLIHVIEDGRLNFQSFYRTYVDILFSIDNQTLLRNITKCLTYLQHENYKESELMDLLISFISDPKNKVALQVYSIYLLIKFVEKYPELLEEISSVIEFNSTEKTAAYIVAQRKFRKIFKI